MCFFGSSQPAAPPRPEFDDAPPVVTGSQTGVDNPIDTAKATETLRIERQETEGFQNPGDSLKIAGLTGKSNKKTIRRVNGKLTKMSTSAYRKSLRNKGKKSFSNRAKGV